MPLDVSDQPERSLRVEIDRYSFLEWKTLSMTDSGMLGRPGNKADQVNVTEAGYVPSASAQMHRHPAEPKPEQ